MSNSSAQKLEMTAELAPEVTSLLQDEVTALEQTEASLDRQLADITARLTRERVRSRELTTNLVATRRDDDRSLLASDEAVSHALVGQQDEAVEVLTALKQKPYFARIVLKEDDEKGGTREVEYKIGYSANPECRIIDWRKAPLSKLYYEYREGDEYFEEIRGRERMGKVVLRNQIEIDRAKLRQVTCRYGTYRASDDGWVETRRGTSSAAANRDFGALPEVLSLISPDQFRAITKDASTTVLIQGVAGSGKTTVALHRLAWLLEAGNSDITAGDSLVLTLGPSLREYIKSSLRRLNLGSVAVFSYREWCNKQVAPHLPKELRRGPNGEIALSGASDRPSMTVERVKRGVGLLRALEERSKTATPELKNDPIQYLLKTLQDSRLIKSLDETKLLNDEVIRMAHDRTAQMVARGTLDRSDFALILRVLQLTKGRGQILGRLSPYKHIVIDEVQDYSPVELATMISVVNDVGNLTLVGDTTQRVEEGFPGWEKLTRHWTARKLASNFLRLDVSHRSTKQIVACASAIGKLEVPRGGRDGERPVWMFARRQEPVLEGIIDWLKRITRKEPNALIGVICFSPASAKEVYKLLKPTFGPLIRLADEGGFSFEEGILVCEAYAAKGLEFCGVMVYQPVASVVPKGEAGSALMYIAATRAQEYLAFASWGAPAVVAGCSGAVLERVDLDVGENSSGEASSDDGDE